MLLLCTTAAAVAKGGPAKASRSCAEAVALRAFNVDSDGWSTACWFLADGKKFVAAVPREGAAPINVRIGLVADGHLLWTDQVQVHRALGHEVSAILSDSEGWIVDLAAQPLARGEGVRVSVVGTSGEDLRVAREVAFLLRPSEKVGFTLIWAGAGTIQRMSFEECLSETVATFVVLDERTIERRYESRLTRPKKLNVASESDCRIEKLATKRFVVR